MYRHYLFVQLCTTGKGVPRYVHEAHCYTQCLKKAWATSATALQAKTWSIVPRFSCERPTQENGLTPLSIRSTVLCGILMGKCCEVTLLPSYLMYMLKVSVTGQNGWHWNQPPRVLVSVIHFTHIYIQTLTSTQRLTSTHKQTHIYTQTNFSLAWHTNRLTSTHRLTATHKQTHSYTPTHTDTQTDSHLHTNRLMSRLAHQQTHIYTQTDRHRHTNRLTATHKETHSYTQTHTDTQTDWHRHTNRLTSPLAMSNHRSACGFSSM